MPAVAGRLAQKQQCEDIVSKTVAEFGRIDVLVNNAAFQMTHETLDDISDEEWVKTFDINITAMFRICKAAVPHMPRGGSIINTSSVNSDMPKPTLLAYATTKGAIANFTGGLAQLLGDKGIRVNSVAPGPIWTPLIPATMTDEDVKASAARHRWGACGSLWKFRRSMCCWPRTKPVTSPARAMP